MCDGVSVQLVAFSISTAQENALTPPTGLPHRRSNKVAHTCTHARTHAHTHTHTYTLTHRAQHAHTCTHSPLLFLLLLLVLSLSLSRDCDGIRLSLCCTVCCFCCRVKLLCCSACGAAEGGARRTGTAPRSSAGAAGL